MSIIDDYAAIRSRMQCESVDPENMDADELEGGQKCPYPECGGDLDFATDPDIGCSCHICAPCHGCCPGVLACTKHPHTFRYREH